MAETALNETGQHRRAAVPLGPQPPGVDVAAAQLARAWLTVLAVNGAAAAGGAGDIPADMSAARRFLTGQSAELISILASSSFRPRQAAAVGHALVEADFVGADVLGRTLRVLMLRLPALTGHGTRAGVTAAELEQRVAAVTEALANGYVRALRDRTLAEQESIRRAELDAERIISEQLRHQATHDPLTGLPNRAAAFGRLAAAVAAGGETRIGVCYLDLDGFKGINDRYGHDAGDELLVRVAGRIGGVARDHRALAARIGGDEFVVLAESSPGVRGMVALAAAVLVEVSRPVPLRIGRVRVSACAGIADCATGSPSAATIVNDADAALYQAKSRGPGRWAVFGQASPGPRPTLRRTGTGPRPRGRARPGARAAAGPRARTCPGAKPSSAISGP